MHVRQPKFEEYAASRLRREWMTILVRLDKVTFPVGRRELYRIRRGTAPPRVLGQIPIKPKLGGLKSTLSPLAISRRSEASHVIQTP